MGGDQYSVHERQVSSLFGKLVGYRSKQGIYARLEPGEYVTEHSTFLCAGTEEVESVALFSASACGLYGFDTSTYLLQDGSTDSGDITIESQLYTVELHAGSTALLEWRGM